MPRMLPDYSRAEKSYRAASIQRDHLTAHVVSALDELDALKREWALPMPEALERRITTARTELERGLDAAETVR